MKRKMTVLTLCAMLLALCSSAEAQQQTKVAKIGWPRSRFASVRLPAPRYSGESFVNSDMLRAKT